MGLWRKVFGPADREGFARLMMAELRRRGAEGTVEFDPAEFKLSIGEKGGMLYLGNAYADYMHVPRKERKNVIQRYASVGLMSREDSDPGWDQAKQMLLPRIRERFYYEALKYHGPGKKEEDPSQWLCYRPINEELNVELVLDYPDAIRSVNDKLMAKWAVSFEDAMAIAKDNLWKRSNEDFARVGPGLYCSKWSDTHDASRMFLHDLIWQLQVKGEHVVMIPNRNLLMVCGSEDQDGLEAMAKVADDVLNQPRPLSGTAFVLKGKNWEPFLPPRESKAYRIMRQAGRHGLALEYAEQKGFLEKIYGEDAFVASFQVFQKDGGELSLGIWIREITDALLPATDWITFMQEGEDGKPSSIGAARFEKVLEVAGELMEKMEYYPVRYRVRAFPTEEQLGAMGLIDKPEFE